MSTKDLNRVIQIKSRVENLTKPLQSLGGAASATGNASAKREEVNSAQQKNLGLRRRKWPLAENQEKIGK